MAVKRTLDIRQTSGYRMLTTEQKKAVDYELTNNSQYYQTDPDSGRSAATKATNLISQAKELGDSYTFTTPQPSKYSFNVYNSDGSVNKAWQQAYEDLGLYRNYLKLSSSGAPKEDNSQDPDSLSNRAYRLYQSRWRQLQEESEQRIEAQQNRAEYLASFAEEQQLYADTIYQDTQTGIVDQGRTRAFQELSFPEQRIVYDFGTDGKPSSRSTEYESQVYRNWLEKSQAYNEQALTDELMTRYAQGLHLNSSGELQRSSLRLSTDEAYDLAEQFSLEKYQVEELVNKINTDSSFRSAYNAERAKAMLETKASEEYRQANNVTVQTAEQRRHETAVAMAEALTQHPEVQGGQDLLSRIETALTGKPSDSTSARQKGYTLAKAVRDFGYGAESTVAAMVGTVEDAIWWLDSQVYLVLEAATSGFGFAPNAVSNWFKEAKESVQSTSYTDQWKQSIDERYNPSETQRKAMEFQQAAAAMLPVIATGALGAGGAAAGAISSTGAVASTGSVLSTLTPYLSNLPQTFMFASAAGGSTRQAIQQGATSEQAAVYGTLSGALELVTEKLVGGVPFLGEGAADKVVSNVVQRLAKNPVMQACILKLGNMLGEGVEEAITAVADPLLQKLTFNPDADPASVEEVVEAGLMGAAISMFFDVSLGGLSSVRDVYADQAAESVRQIVQNTDYGSYDSDKLWDQGKIERLASYVGNGEGVVVSGEVYDALRNSRTELTKAEQSYQQAVQAFTQALEGGKRLSVNNIRSYESAVRNAANKLQQTRQAMLASEQNWTRAFQAAKDKAFEAETQLRSQEAAENLRRQELAQQERAQVLDLYKQQLLSESQRAQLALLEDGNVALSAELVETAQNLGFAPKEAAELRQAFFALAQEQEALSQDVESLAAYQAAGQSDFALQAQQSAAQRRSQIQFLEHALNLRRQAYVQQAQAELFRAGERDLGTSNADSARKVLEQRRLSDQGAAAQTEEQTQPLGIQQAEAQAAPQADAQSATVETRLSRVYEDGSMDAGQVTHIQRPYQGEKPSYAQGFDPDGLQSLTLGAEELRAAEANIRQAEVHSQEGGGYKSRLKELYSNWMERLGGGRRYEVTGLTMNGEPYLVTVHKSLLGKVISGKVDAAKLALLPHIPQIIQNGRYVGSGETGGGKATYYIQRYDYFETQLSLDGRPYVAAFDVEVRHDNNRMRTYRVLRNMNLQAADATQGTNVQNKMDLEALDWIGPGPKPGDGQAPQVHLQRGNPGSPADISVPQTNSDVNTPIADSGVERFTSPAATGRSGQSAPFDAEETAQRQAAWEQARKETEVEGTFVGEDGLRRSAQTGSYLAYEMGQPDAGRRGHTLRSRNEIVHELSEAFHTPVVFGTDSALSSNQAAGLHYRHSGLTKVRYPNDIHTALHEIGHQSDALLDLGELPGVDRVIDAFPQSVRDAYGNDAGSLKAEAVAESFAMYVNNPQAARALWPQFVEALEQGMDASQRRAVRRASSSLRAEAAASVQERLANHIVDHTKGPGAVQRLAEGIYSKRRGFESVWQTLLDAEVVFSRLDQDLAKRRTAEGMGGWDADQRLYTQAVVNRASRARAKGMLTQALYDKNYTHKVADGFSSCFEQLNAQELRQLDLYLNMEAGLEREAQGKNVWPKDISREAIAQELETLKKENPKLSEAAQKVHSWWESFMEEQVVARGLLTKEAWETFKTQNPHYIPLTRSLYDEDYSRFGTGQTATPVTKRMVGSSYDTFSAVQELSIKIIDLVAKGEKTDFDRALFRAVTQTPGMAEWAVETTLDGQQGEASVDAQLEAAIGDWSASLPQNLPKDVLPVRMEDGKLRFLKIKDEGLLAYYDYLQNQAATPAQRQQLAERAIRALGSMNRSLSYLLAAGNPTFWVRNVQRDTLEGFTTTKSTAEHTPLNFMSEQLGGHIEAFLDQFMDGKYSKTRKDPLSGVELFKATGGSGGLYGSLSSAEGLRGVMNEVTPQSRGKLISLAQGVQNVLSFLGEVTETGSRVAEFKRVYDPKKNNWREALYAAKRFSVNFDGSGTGTDWVRRVFLFAGASMNSLNKDLRAMTGKEFLQSDGSVNRKAQAEWVAKKSLGIGVLAFLSQMLLGLGLDHEEDAALPPDYLQDGSFLLPLSWMGEGMQGTYLKLAVPDGFSNALVNELGQMVGRLVDGEDLQLHESLMDVLGALSPIGEINQQNPTGSSAVYSAFQQALNNRSWTGAQIDSEWDLQKSPGLRSDENTTGLAKRLGEWLNLSPKRIDYVLEQYGSYLYDAYDLLDDGQALDLAAIPQGVAEDLKSLLLANCYYSTDAFSNFYGAIDQLDTVLADADAGKTSLQYRKGLSPEEVLQANEEAATLQEALTDLSYDMSEIRKEMDALEEEGASQAELLALQRELAALALDGLLKFAPYAEMYLK